MRVLAVKMEWKMFETFKNRKLADLRCNLEVRSKGKIEAEKDCRFLP